MSAARPDWASVVEKALREEGLTDDPAHYDGDIHSWRCSHPDIYGPCKCFAETVAHLAAALDAAYVAHLGAEETREAAWGAIARVRDASPRTTDDADSWDVLDAALATLTDDRSTTP